MAVLRSMRPWLTCAILVSLMACQRPQDGALPGTLERERLELSAEANEPIVEIPVREGQVVKRGDLLLVQDRGVASAQLARAAAATAQAQAQLDELRHGARGTTLRAAQARRDRVKVQRDEEARERERLKTLVTQNLVSRASLDRQIAATAVAAAALAEAEAALRELQQGSRSEQIAQAQQALEQTRAQQRELTTITGRLEVRAPLDATVDALPYRVSEKPLRGATVVILLAAGAPFARIHVPEPLRLRVRVGTLATIRIDGATTRFKGRVRYIATEPAFTPYYALTENDRSQLSYLAEIVLDEPRAATLPAGIPLTVQLTLDVAP